VTENLVCPLYLNKCIPIYLLLKFCHAPQTFSKEVDDKSSLKSSVVSTANQLFHVKQADTAGLRSSLAKFEQKWGELITQLPAIHEKLPQVRRNSPTISQFKRNNYFKMLLLGFSWLLYKACKATLS